MNNRVTGIILSAGDSTRYGKGINKNFDLLNDKEVLNYSFDVFNKSEYIDDIIIVFKNGDIGKILDIIKNNIIEKPISLVEGGKTRKDSVYNALLHSNNDYVIIHDGARPIITNNYIKECLSNMKRYDGVSIGVKSTDTIKITDNYDEVINTTKRSNTWIVQTPQCFKRDILLKCHENHLNDKDITDDAMLLELDGYKVKMIEGDYSNIKITTQDDLVVAKTLIKRIK